MKNTVSILLESDLHFGAEPPTKIEGDIDSFMLESLTCPSLINEPLHAV
ncbi:hypothetical protein NST63_23810 [Heyndrickxia sp. FSL W8-0496]|jgi:hypothetical protein